MTQMRIGSPPTAPARARRRWPLFAVLGLAALLVVGGAAYAGISVAQHDKRGTAAPSASTAAFSPSMTCEDLVPLLGKTSDGVDAMMSRPDQIPDSLQPTAYALRRVAVTAPSDWKDDIGIQFDMLERLIQTGGRIEQVADVLKTIPTWSAAFTRLTDRCKPYYS